MELGLTTFAETMPAPDTGDIVDHGTRLRQVVAEAELAEAVGLDVYAVGEHHRPDFAVSAPAVVLAAIAARTRSIRLSPAVTILSSDDPVRVFQQFATLDLLSEGRTELMVGRGSFIESFPLFGYDLADYDELFAEKLDLLLQIQRQRACDVAGTIPPTAGRSDHHTAARPGPIADLGRRGWKSSFDGARRPARASRGARHHRRRSRQVRRSGRHPSQVAAGSRTRS
jgi:alkanesulfonate monooxygenase SsuD/methylene tetrahydromethanopterin reductase-like flavin-dependent oxidoreductase (luciferase family)